VGVFAGASPWWDGHAKYMSWYRRAMAWASVYSPGPLAAALSTSVAFLKWFVSTRPVVRWIDGLLEKMRSQKVAEEKEFGLGEGGELSITESRERMLQLLFEGFRQGSMPTVHEAKLLSGPTWGFQLESVDYDPVRIWHGAKDANTPIEAIRYMAKLMPHSDLQELEDDTHYTMAKHMAKALSDLVPEEELKRHNAIT